LIRFGKSRNKSNNGSSSNSKAPQRRISESPKGNTRKSKAPGSSKDNSKTLDRAKKITLVLARFVFAASLTGATIWAGLAAYKHATTASYFSVNDFTVDGLKRLTKSEVLVTAGLNKGINIFRVDGAMSIALLRRHLWIADAKVRRQLPRSVEIEIVERQAVSTVFFDVPYLVDDSGEVFKRWVRGDPSPSPMITGLSREQFIEDPDAIQGIIRDAIDLGRRYRSAGLERTAPLAEIHYELDGGFSLAIGSDQTYVKFGQGPYRRKLARLATLLSRLRSDGQSASMIYFDNKVRPDRVTVKIKPKKDNTDLPTQQPNLPNPQKRLSKI
jgi:cell division protein FtsQ